MRRRAQNDLRPRRLSDDCDPWERQPAESDPAWLAFRDYRDMPLPRTIRAVAAKHEKNRKLLERWSKMWSWPLRVREYDRSIDDKVRADHQKAILSFRKRAADQARAKAQSLMIADMALSRILSDPRKMEELAKLDPVDLLHLVAKSAQALPAVLKAEALALGDITDRPAEPNGTVDPLVEALRTNVDARAHLAAALERLGPGARAAGGVRDQSESRQVD